MTSVSCLKCGLVSWAAEGGVCRRCGTPAATAPARPSANAFEYDDEAPEAAELSPPRTLGILLTILGALLCCGGVIIMAGSNPTPYFLVVGIGIAVSGLLVASGKRAGLYVYFITFTVIVVWTLAGSGVKTGEIMPRLFMPTLLALGLAREKVRARLS
jgi:hypothetical protein